MASLMRRKGRATPSTRAAEYTQHDTRFSWCWLNATCMQGKPVQLVWRVDYLRWPKWVCSHCIALMMCAALHVFSQLCDQRDDSWYVKKQRVALALTWKCSSRRWLSSCCASASKPEACATAATEAASSVHTCSSVPHTCTAEGAHLCVWVHAEVYSHALHIGKRGRHRTITTKHRSRAIVAYAWTKLSNRATCPACHSQLAPVDSAARHKAACRSRNSNGEQLN
jgi:hypothetical protein